MHIISVGKEYNDSMEGAKNMELAKITSKGQITIPIQIRRKLNLKDGDKVVFIEQGGKIVIENSTRMALMEAQEAFKGEAERLGLNIEQDVVDMVKQIRREIQEEKNADNA
jgi:AbrB family looped-hinge helix DNA binding protein